MTSPLADTRRVWCVAHRWGAAACAAGRRTTTTRRGRAAWTWRTHASPSSSRRISSRSTPRIQGASRVRFEPMSCLMSIPFPLPALSCMHEQQLQAPHKNSGESASGCHGGSSSGAFARRLTALAITIVGKACTPVARGVPKKRKRVRRWSKTGSLQCAFARCSRAVKQGTWGCHV